MPSFNPHGVGTPSGSPIETAYRRPTSLPVVGLAPHSRKPALARKGSSTSVIRDPGDQQVRIAESNIEKNLILVLMADPDVKHVASQPEPQHFLDGSGKRYKHTFDVKAELRSGERLLIEVKPWNKVVKHDWKSWIDEVSPQVPRSVADSVLLVTERDLPLWLVRNASIINSVRNDAPRAVEHHIEKHALEVARPLSLRQLTEPFGGPGAVLRAAVRLIYERRLKLVRPDLISAATLVFADGTPSAGHI